MSAISWTDKQKSTGKWFVITGTAYENVIQGKNRTNEVTSDYTKRDEFYYDEAVRLSEHDLNQSNGVDGLPICVEHDTDDVVGVVHHSWSGTGTTRAINIIARVNLDSKRGREVVADIKAGKLQGFSIGYAAGLSTNSLTGRTTLDTKKINEISIVARPFFPNCHLSMGVEASRRHLVSVNASGRNSATNNANYLSNDLNDDKNSDSGKFFVPITAMSIPATDAQRAAVPGEELLKQADSLKEDNSRIQAELQALRANQAELEALRAEKKAAEQKRLDDEKRADMEYERMQEPKFNAIVEELQASRKEKFTPQQLEGYRQSICDRKYAGAAKDLEAQHQERVQLRASLKEAQDAAAKAKEEAEQLKSVVTKTNHTLNHSRIDYAKGVDSASAAADDEKRRKIDTEVKASLGLNQIVNPHPSINELPFLRAYGYTSEVNVNASQQDYDNEGIERRPFVTATSVAASHKFLKDPQTQERNYPDSARYHSPAFFGWMCDNEYLRNGDLTGVVNLVASKNLIEDKRTEEWEARRHQLSGGAE